MEPRKNKSTGKYEVRWRVRTGNKEVRHKRTFSYRKDAVEFIEGLAVERRRNANAAKRTFNNYADRYLMSAAARCKPRTVTGYSASLRHARDFLGDRQVGTLRKSDAEAFLACLNTALKGRRTRSLRATWRTFSAVLDSVVDDEALASNPARKVKLPTANSRGERKFKPAFLRPQDVSNLAANLPEPYGLLVQFTAFTGLRRGEVAGLNIGHVRLILSQGRWTGKVIVEQTARRTGGVWVLDTPKTERSTREVPLPSWLAVRMHDYLADHPFGDTPDHPLWPGRRRGGYTHGVKSDSVEHGAVDWSSRWEPESFCRNVFADAVKNTDGLARVRFHDLRHTFASICSDKGIAVGRVSAWMGHSTTSITLDTYTHLFRGDEDAVAVESLTEPPQAQPSNVVPIERAASR